MVFGDAPALLASGLRLVYPSLQLMDMVPWTVHLCLDIDREPSALGVRWEVVTHVGSSTRLICR